MEGKIKTLGYKSKTLSWLSYGKSHSHVGELTELTGRLKTQAWKWATKKGQAGKPVRRSYRCHRWARCYSARPALGNSISITVTPTSCLCHPSFGHRGCKSTLHLPKGGSMCIWALWVYLPQVGHQQWTKEMVPSLCSLVNQWVLDWAIT